MVSPEPRRIGVRLDSGSSGALAEPERLWSGRIRRAKLHRPVLPAGAVARPRIMARIDEGQRPLTLIVAPAGFGKTVAAAEWANQEPPAAWLTADPADASLYHFWAHLREALAGVAPEFGELVTASLEIPHRAPAVDLGRMLADELLDVRQPVRLVLDDLHLVPGGEAHEFLAGLLEIAPPGFRLLIAARSEPPLPLTRMRLRGEMTDIRSSDLLFTEDETRVLVESAVPDDPSRISEKQAAALWLRTRGWAAGLRLGAIGAARNASPEAIAAAAAMADNQLLAGLLDETLAERSPRERETLLRAALPDRFDAHLVAALAGGDDAFETARETIRFALASDLCRPSARFGGDWLEFHPLFREGLRQRLEAEMTPEALSALHVRAATWFETAAHLDAAIGHRIAAGEADTALALVEREIQPAFDREDWPEVARWLALLPDETVRERLPLLLARGWLAHIRGQGTLLKDTLRVIEERLARGDISDAAAEVMRDEMDIMVLGTALPFQIDPDAALATARRVVARFPRHRRFQLGLAWALFGMALQAAGAGDEAVERLTWWTETEEDRIDAGSIRGLLGLLFVHEQGGHLARVEHAARTEVGVAERHRLRLSAGWAHRFLGNVSYERNDLADAITHYGAIARDYEYFHLTGLREAFFGLALAYLAEGRQADAWRALRRSREILIEAGAMEHLPALEAHEAYVALLTGGLPRALAWARASDAGVDSATFHVMVHPVVIRAAILCTAGDGELDEAIALLAELRQRAARAHFTAALVRIEALAAIAHVKRGDRVEALAAMDRSLAIGVPQGFIRSYLDLVPLFTPELRELAAAISLPPVLRAALDAPAAEPARAARRQRALPMADLTEREREVLSALSQRLSYKEIADQFYISPLTVKRHVSSVYSKLGVSGRFDAIRMARELGWQA